MTDPATRYYVRHTTPEDFAGIAALTRAVYPRSPPWNEEQLASHLEVFPEGQFVAVDRETGEIVGMAASLVILWDDYEQDANWRDFTGAGTFTNHDPEYGRTLYGAEIMVRPDLQGRGIGKLLYAARRDLVMRLGLVRIRAGARLRHYHKYAAEMSAEDYAVKLARGELSDPTLSFQLAQGFEIFKVVSGYIPHDPESLGYAALIEWLNPEVATPEDSAKRDPRFRRPAAS